MQVSPPSVRHGHCQCPARLVTFGLTSGAGIRNTRTHGSTRTGGAALTISPPPSKAKNTTGADPMVRARPVAFVEVALEVCVKECPPACRSAFVCLAVSASAPARVLLILHFYGSRRCTHRRRLRHWMSGRRWLGGCISCQLPRSSHTPDFVLAPCVSSLCIVPLPEAL